MKIKVDEVEILEIEEWEKRVMENDIPRELLYKDLCTKIQWVLRNKVERCFERLSKEWLKKFREDPTITSIPNSKKDFVEFVLAHPDYKSKSQRVKENID